MLDSETDERIKWLSENDYIFPSEARALRTYFKSETVKQAAKRLNYHLNSLRSVFGRLVKRKVLVRVERGVYALSDETPVRTKELHERQEKTLCDLTKQPLTITPDERKWMKQNYHKHSRSQVAKILGRSKFDVNRMAIVLKLDSGRGGAK